MITKLIVNDNRKSPVKYICDLDAFRNGIDYDFKPGVNIIVGENGSGKTTLLELLRRYLMVDYTSCGRGMYNSNMSKMYMFGSEDIADGVDVYADYSKNTFRMCHSDEKSSESAITTFKEFGTMYTQKTSSTGESVLISMDSLFSEMFSKDAKLKFDYEKECSDFPDYVKYVGEHRVECEDEWTILMDEPDRNLSIDNIRQIKSILSFHKENTQIIAVIHNPLLIYALSDCEDINWIQMSHGYIRKVKTEIDKIVRKNA